MRNCRKPVRPGYGLRLTITQTVPKPLGAVSFRLWCLLRGVLPPVALTIWPQGTKTSRNDPVSILAAPLPPWLTPH